MNKTLKEILKIFATNPKKRFSRREIEEQMEGIGRRTIIRALSELEKEKRIERLGGGSAVKYLFSHAYHQDFEHKFSCNPLP